MALYRENATGFVQEHASNPGSGYTLISSQPTDTIANRVTWWRDVDKGSLTSAWHPSLQTGDPESPAPDDGAGRGINILPNDYASFEWPAGLPPTHTTNATISQQTNRIHGEKCARVTLSSAGGVAWLSASGQFNILLTANRKWIMSWFVKPSTAVARTASIRLTTATATYTVSGTTDGSTSWQRLSGVFDLTADAATEARIGLSLDTTGVALDFDGLMLEEQIGRESDPSPFYSPWGFGSVTKPEYWPDYGIPTIKLYSDLQARINLIDGASSLDGSVNKRLADQYTGLVQQINQVSVGNGQFDSKIIYYFDQSSEITGWTGTSASLAVSGGFLAVTATGSNPKFKTATIAVDGSAYPLVRLRVKRTGGSGWTGTLRYYYSGGSDVLTVSEPSLVSSEYVEVDWDLSAQTLYTGNTITAIEIQLGTASGDNYSIDWLGVGRNAPGASFSQVEAVRVLSDNKTRVFYQNAAPTSDANYTLKANDLWFDTDDGNKPYRWTGSAWAETTDTRLADSWSEILDIRNATANPSGAAAQRINSISATASAKNRTFYQASTSSPSSPTAGDLWFQTDQGNKAFRWSGSAWVETTDTRLPTAVASINTIETARIGYCTIGGNTSVHGDKTACEAAGGTWATGLPWATAVKQVSITAGNGQSATVQQQFETIYGAGGLRAQYSVKLDVNGYTVGFGLYNEGAGANGFIVRADKFVVGSAGSNRTPFVIDGGVTYIDAAVIKDGAITSAKIATLNADKITAGTIGSQTIALNGVSSILKSSNYVAGSAGWQIRGDGYAEFRNVTIRGSLNASDVSGGTLNFSNITVSNLRADSITVGTINTDQITSGAVTYSFADTTGPSFGYVSNVNTGYFTMASHIIPAVSAGSRGRILILANLNTQGSVVAPMATISIQKQAYDSSGGTVGSPVTLMTDVDFPSSTSGLYGRVFVMAVDQSFDTNQIGILFRVLYQANAGNTVYARGSFTIMELKR